MTFNFKIQVNVIGPKELAIMSKMCPVKGGGTLAFILIEFCL
jgi:hypothetical protein